MGRKATTKNAARGKKASTAQESSGKKAPPGQAPRPPLAVSEWVYTLIKCKSPEALAAMAEGANRAHPVWKEEHQSLYDKFEKKVTRNKAGNVTHMHDSMPPYHRYLYLMHLPALWSMRKNISLALRPLQESMQAETPAMMKEQVHQVIQIFIIVIECRSH